MRDYKPQVGDRVRVTIEAEVTYVGSTGFGLGEATWITSEVKPSVEKIEPPVEVFGPGDRIRRKGWGTGGYELTLGKGGYIHHSTNQWLKSDTQLTSECYERVTLS